MRFPAKTGKGTRAVAQLLGVSQRTVERYVKGRTKRPRPELADRLAREVHARWQPRVRERARRRAATTGGIMRALRHRLFRLRQAVGVLETVSALRVCDVVVWTAHRQEHRTCR